MICKVTQRSHTYFTLLCYLKKDEIVPAPALHMASYDENPVETQTLQMRSPKEKKHLKTSGISPIVQMFMIETYKFLYLDPEPFSHNFYPPVWIQLITDKPQVAGPVCDPGDH